MPRSTHPPIRRHPLLWGGDLQTIVPALWPSPPFRFEFQTLEVEVEPGTRVQLKISDPVQSGTASRCKGTVLLIHGMGGSADSGYIVRSAERALEDGFRVIRMNLRTCGGTERLSRTLYNAGQSDDVDRVLAALEPDLPRPVVAVGYSLSGNIVLRYAALAGDACRADRVMGINPPADLEQCLQSLETRRNRLYDRYYVYKVCRQLQAVAAVRELDGPAPDPRTLRGIRHLDTLFTAPDAGFGSAEEYYAAASAAPNLGSACRPALILSAINDPFVPPDLLRPLRSDLVDVRLPASGGHCGYWQRGRPRFWAAEAILDFARSARH